VVIHATSPRRPTGDLHPKSRARGFFGTRPLRARRSAPAALQPRRENRPVPTKPASGIPVWPSRDPIGEEGGANLYAFVTNTLPNRIDSHGLRPEPIDPPAITEDQWLDNGCPDDFESYLHQELHSILRESAEEEGCRISLRCKCSMTKSGAISQHNSITKMVRILIYYRPGENPDAGALLHELVHARDFCQGWLKDDCRSSVCSEMKAYKAQFEYSHPDVAAKLSPEQMKKLITESVYGSSGDKCGDGAKAVEKAREVYDECVGSGSIY